MYLSDVQINNFRSLKDLHVQFQKGLNVLVGRNNTGKTNLLHAIRLALGPSASHGDTTWIERDDFYKESSSDESLRTITIKLTFEDLSEAQRSQFYEIVDFNLAEINKSKAVIQFEASWPKNKRHALIKRTCGLSNPEPLDVPNNILESLPITFLPALRDAEASLAPGARSRLARLLQDVANRKNRNDATEIKAIYSKANEELEKHNLIKTTRDSLQTTTKDIAGNDYSSSVIRTVEADFDRILRSLQVQMEGTPLAALDANGLGYNNLLYIAVVLEHLKSQDIDEFPLLLVEEPEAHLHPQLTMLLADYLANNTPGKSTPQTIITTHSPTLAANVPPSKIQVMFSDMTGRCSKCNSIALADMEDKEQHELQRMMDVTRATLYFARAVIFVEGISEALLVPILAKRLGYDLNKLHISVIPICGVAFETFKKILNPSVLGIPVSIITDGDPPIFRGESWENDSPQTDGVNYKLSDRTKKILEVFDGHVTVKIFHSKVTLEYDLAEAGDGNALLMAEVWESCFIGQPGTFNKKKVSSQGISLKDKALITWRGICRADHSGSKADFAHRLTEYLSIKDASNHYVHTFEVPQYIRLSIEKVVNILNQNIGHTQEKNENTNS